MKNHQQQPDMEVDVEEQRPGEEEIAAINHQKWRTGQNYYRWCWLTAGGHPLLESHRKFVGKKACQAEAELLKPITKRKQVLEMRKFDPNGRCLCVTEFLPQREEEQTKEQQNGAGLDPYIQPNDADTESEPETRGKEEIPDPRPEASEDPRTVSRSAPIHSFIPSPENVHQATKAAARPRLVPNRVVYSGSLITTGIKPRGPDDEDIKVQALYYGEEARIDIRRWKGNQPTERGLYISPICFQQLLGLEKWVDVRLQKIKDKQTVDDKAPVYGPVYISMVSPFWCINIRRYDKDVNTGDINPTSAGIIIRHDQWANLIGKAHEMVTAMPEISTSQACYLQDDHQNQEVR